MEQHSTTLTQTQIRRSLKADYGKLIGSTHQKKQKQGRNQMVQFQVFDHLQEGIAIIDYTLSIRYWNKALAGMVAIPQFAEFGQNIFSVLPPAFENFLHPAFNEILKSGVEKTNICSLGSSAADRRVFKYRMAAMNGEKSVKYIILSLIEITDSYRLDRAKDQREYLENWGILSVGVTQELTQPLDDIYKISQNLQINSRIVDQPQMKKQLDLIEEKIYRISYLIHNLVGLSHDTVPHFSSVNLSSLIEELEQSWCASNEGRLGFAIEMADSIPLVLGNRVLLFSVLQNLMRMIGSLAGPDVVPRLIVSVLEDENNVKVTIANGKPGLTNEEIEHLLDLFYNGTKISPGTGLALFISKRVVELHGYLLEIRNDEKYGTVFEIVLQQS